MSDISKIRFMSFEDFRKSTPNHVFVFACVEGTVIGSPEADIARKEYGRTQLGDHPLQETKGGFTYAVHHRRSQIAPVTVENFKEQMKLLAEHIKVSELPFFIPNLTYGQRDNTPFHERVRAALLWIDTPEKVVFERLWAPRFDPSERARIAKVVQERTSLTYRVAKAAENQKLGIQPVRKGTMFNGAWNTNISGY